MTNFDIFGNTLLSLALVGIDIPERFVHRTLDDVPVVAPQKSKVCENFTCNYVNVCKIVGVKLAEQCSKNEKAFVNTTTGKVIGIYFDTLNMSWKLPKDKRDLAIKCLEDCKSTNLFKLENLQILLGRLNNISQMCPFMRIFNNNLNISLAQLLNSPVSHVTINMQCENDMRIWLNFLNDKEEWLPITPMYNKAPIAHKSFTSDAAGCPEGLGDGELVGCGNIGFSFDGIVIFAYQMFWPSEIIQFASDNKMKRLGNKTTTLEFLGILIPFLVIPESLCDQHIEVKVDNSGCYFGWLNRHVKEDVLASILIRALHLISAYLGCQVHITHLPRKSTWDAMVVDRLSRSVSTTESDRRLVESFDFPKPGGALLAWMKNPREDWNLPFNLLCEVRCKLERK